MNLEFLLFTPPKRKCNILDFWGQTIFVPKMRKKIKQQSLFSFLNCYNSTHNNQNNHTIDITTSQYKILDLISQDTNDTHQQQQEIQRYIPCLFLNSMVGSKYLLIYFHSSGEDIKLARPLLDLIRNLFQINVLALQYPGYSIYESSISSERIKQDASFIFNYMINKLGFHHEQIIVMGRSIGTGVSLQLLQKHNPGALVLISPFSSVKSLAREHVGFMGQWLTKQIYDNRTNIFSVSCPTFILHGQKDNLIPIQHTKQLSKLCHMKKKVIYSPNMTHSDFDFYTDLADPLREFLMENGFNLYESKQEGPTIPDQLFQLPQKLIF